MTSWGTDVEKEASACYVALQMAMDQDVGHACFLFLLFPGALGSTPSSLRPFVNGIELHRVCQAFVGAGLQPVDAT